MHRNRSIIGLLLIVLLSIGCSGGGHGPLDLDPSINNPLQVHKSQSAQPTQTHLWGYYDVHIDVENQKVDAVPNRDVMFTVNVVTFLNNIWTSLKFSLNDLPIYDNSIGVDIDVSITHPIPGANQYDGYDVRGIFIGDGAGMFNYGSGLTHPVSGTDQFHLNSDGYTRWFNPNEFGVPGLGGFTDGVYASEGYTGDSEINSYKYFANNLGANDDLFTWLNDHSSFNGVFVSGSTCTRNYILDFPNAKGTIYDYAVLASWKGEAPEDHPANCPETVGVDVTVTPDIYYVDGVDHGGDFILDVSIFGWDQTPSAIYVESPLLSFLYTFDPTDMTPVDTGEKYATYHVEFPADNVTSNNDSNFWVICEYDTFNYVSELEIPNSAGTDSLAGFFRFDISVEDNQPPNITSGVDGNADPVEMDTETYSVTAVDPDSDALTWLWTVTDVASGNPVDGFDGVAGDGAGNLDVDFSTFPNAIALAGSEFDIDCSVTDSNHGPVNATTLTVKVDVDGDVWVSNNSDFSGPGTGTKTDPYTTLVSALAGSSTGDVVVIDNGGSAYNDQLLLNYGSPTSDNRTFRGYSWYTDTGGRPSLSNNGGGEMCYGFNANGVTFQGLEFLDNSSNTTSISYLEYCDNVTIRDCTFTGTNATSRNENYGLRCIECNNLTSVNNKFYDINFGFSQYGRCYATYFIHCDDLTFSRNEITDINGDTKTGILQNITYAVYLYIYDQATVTNNLIHHIEMESTSTEWYAYNGVNGIYSDSGLSVTEFSHNTLDTFDGQNNTTYPFSEFRGIAVFSSSDVWFGVDVNSSIVSNMQTSSGDGNYGIFSIFFNINDALEYNNVWNTDHTAYFQIPGPLSNTNIEADPDFVNNTTEPYDYHLNSGSACEGTGQNGEDMGCYGNLDASEVVGLLTPE